MLSKHFYSTIVAGFIVWIAWTNAASRVADLLPDAADNRARVLNTIVN